MHHIRFITPEEQHRFTGGQSNNFAGNFVHTGHHHVHILLPLDDFDKSFTADVSLKPGESIFRYKTDTTMVADMKPLIKINVERGLAYFLVEGAELPVFEKRGIKIKYINLLKK